MKIFFFSIIINIIFFRVTVFSQNFWEATSGPEGGWTHCIAADKQNNLYSGFDAGRYGNTHRGNCFYKSVNGGVSWQSIGIYADKDIESVAIDSSGTIYVWSGYSGVFRSTNGGTSWTDVTHGLYIYYDGILGVCKNNFIILGHYYGVYVSTDNAVNWNLTSLTDPINSIYIDNNDNIFAGIHYGGLFRSADYGNSWVRVDNGLNSEVNAVLKIGDSSYFSATNAGIFKSSDNCNSWNFLNGSPANVTSLTKGIDEEIFAGTTNKGFFLSTDQGNNWTSKNDGLKNLYITSMVSLPDNSVIIGTYGDGLFKSNDQGQTWQSINAGIKSVHATSFLSYNQFLLAGSQEGMIYRSPDKGDSWNRIDSTYTYMPVTAFLKSRQNSLFFSSWDYSFKSENHENNSVQDDAINRKKEIAPVPGGKIYKSTDDGNTWEETTQIPVNSFSSYYDQNSGIEYLMAASDYLGVMKSTDDGITWLPANNGIDGFLQDIGTNSNGDFFASSTNNIFRSTDFGTSWQIVYTYPDICYRIVLSISNNDFIYAGFDWGKGVRSTDNGYSWTDIGTYTSIYGITSIATDSINRVYIGDRYGNIFQSFDDGEDWVYINSGMIGGAILNLKCDKSGNIFVGPYGGCVYRNATNLFVPQSAELDFPANGAQNISLTPELKWHPASTANLYRAQVSMHSGFDSTDIIFDMVIPDTMCTIDSLQGNTRYYWRVRCANEYGWSYWSNSRWFKTLNPLATADEIKNILYFELEQNYPNPFNPETIINYSIPDEWTPISRFVQLKVYNVLGEEAAVLVNEEKFPGKYRAKFDGRRLASGTYIYKLTVGSYTAVKKMMIIK